jgi:hypothetical protein
MKTLAWTSRPPTVMGYYYAVMVEHPIDVGRDEIQQMASGWLQDPRPVPFVAEICEDEDEPEKLIPWFAGLGEYPFSALAEDYAAVYWYGPLPLPPPLEGLGPMRPPGENQQVRFRLPEGWPPQEA